MKTLPIAVFGSTGAQGSPVVRALLQAGFSVRAVARSAGKISAIHGKDVSAATADLNDVASIAQVLRGVAGAFFHLPLQSGPQSPAQQLQVFIEAARAEQLPFLVFSTSGPTGERHGDSALTLANRSAASVVLASGIPSVVLAPSLYLENILVPPFVPQLFDQGVLDYPPLSPQRRVSWTTQQDQARLVAASFTRPELAGRTYEVASQPAITGPELAALLAPWVGRAVRYQPQTPEAFGDRLGALFGDASAGRAIADMYAALDAQPADASVIDTDELARTFGVVLPPLQEQVADWPKRGES
jgi:uncharacterized protein YbjT (DUF2867 family)